jgi:glycosyltransferase involved in cell wall biosynthesis
MIIKPKIAVIIPAYNEELTICDVLKDFHSYNNKDQYEYKIYIIDNNSKDKTRELAQSYIEKNHINAEILFVKRQGKANAIRYALRMINADCYIMVDADCTYWAEDLDKFIKPILFDNIDMVIGDRLSTGAYAQENDRNLHQFGNNLVKKMINKIFRANLQDIMSGYRGFSRELVKNYPINCEGFELETDLSIFCLAYRFNIMEVPIKFTSRPDGSFSKLNTLSDGIKVIMTIFNMFRVHKPLQFFSIIASLALILGFSAGMFPIINYIESRYVSQVPMAILAVGLVITSIILLVAGIILSNIKIYHDMLFELQFIKNNKSNQN